MPMFIAFIFVAIAVSNSAAQQLPKDTIRQNAKKGQSPFYWQPKLLISMAAPKKVYDINQVVLLRGYKLGITMMALVEGLPERKKHHHLNPLEAEFYTNAYRWFLRHMELVTPWLYGEAGSYYETIKLWNTRFLMADTFLPKWMQKLLIHIPAEDWEAERTDFRAFTKYAAITFAKHLRYPSNDTRRKDWWKSHESKDSADELPPLVDPNEKHNTATGAKLERRMQGTGGILGSDPNRTDTDDPEHRDAETAFMAMSENEKRLMFEKFLLEAADAVQRDSQRISERGIGRPDDSQNNLQLLSDSTGDEEGYRGQRQPRPEALRSSAPAREATINILIIICLSLCLLDANGALIILK